MKDQKLLILKMLDEGKITSQEALDLLEAISNDKQSEQSVDSPDQENNGFIKTSGRIIGKLLAKLDMAMSEPESNSASDSASEESSLSENPLNPYRTISNNYKVSSPVDFIEIDNPYGKIEISSHDQDIILYNNEISYFAFDRKVDEDFLVQEVEENSFKINVFRDNLENPPTIDLFIYLPKKLFKSLNIKTGSSASISELETKSLDIDNLNSKVSLTRSRIGKFSAKSMNGSFDIESSSFDLYTNNLINCDLRLDMLDAGKAAIKNTNGTSRIGSLGQDLESLDLAGLNASFTLENLNKPTRISPRHEDIHLSLNKDFFKENNSYINKENSPSYIEISIDGKNSSLKIR